MMSVAKRPATAAGTIALRPRARILRTFGDELISSETVAVIELVKNAYDADATRVLVRFQGPLEIGKGSIEVIDNGHGMSLDTILNTWMEPATLMRKRNLRSEQRERRVLGEKGVGRFAASRLADRLEIITRRAEMSREVRVILDWTHFDNEEKYLDQIVVPWEEVEPTEICATGTMQLLWDESSQPAKRTPNQGTILRMLGLRANWAQNELQTLRTGLSRLISPFLGQDELTRSDEFQIDLQLPPSYGGLSGIVRPPEALQNPHYLLKGAVDKAGHYSLRIRLRNQDEFQSIERSYIFPDGRLPQCGPFSIELRVWDRDQSSMSDLANAYDSTIANVRRDLDDVAGINIYRDGFRVLPYGEPQNDWLRLDLRRVQKPSFRLSNNQIVGYVLISADSNPQLRDQSNREGLIEGPALDDLRALVTAVLAELETRRQAARSRQKAPPSGGLFTQFDLVAIRDIVKRRHPEDIELLTLIDEKGRDIDKRIEEVQEVLARYRRLATLGQLIDIVLHDGRAPLSKITSEALLGLRDIARGNYENLNSRLHKRLETISTQSDVLATVFRRIEPFGGRKRGRPTNARLEQVITDAFSVLDTEIKEVGATVSLPNTDTQVNVDQAEIQQVIINLLQNSLYWLRQVPKGHRHISVAVNRKDSDEVEVMFSDTGPGIDPEFGDLIFDPYFSTKPDGIGLGLTIAGEIVSEYYKGDLELLDSSDQQQGATFRIALRRRV